MKKILKRRTLKNYKKGQKKKAKKKMMKRIISTIVTTIKECHQDRMYVVKLNKLRRKFQRKLRNVHKMIKYKYNIYSKNNEVYFL